MPTTGSVDKMSALHVTDVLIHIYKYLDFYQSCRLALVHCANALCLARGRVVHVNNLNKSTMCLFSSWCHRLRWAVSPMVETHATGKGYSVGTLAPVELAGQLKTHDPSSALASGL